MVLFLQGIYQVPISFKYTISLCNADAAAAAAVRRRQQVDVKDMRQQLSLDMTI